MRKINHVILILALFLPVPRLWCYEDIGFQKALKNLKLDKEGLFLGPPFEWNFPAGPKDLYPIGEYIPLVIYMRPDLREIEYFRISKDFYEQAMHNDISNIEPFIHCLHAGLHPQIDSGPAPCKKGKTSWPESFLSLQLFSTNYLVTPLPGSIPRILKEVASDAAQAEKGMSTDRQDLFSGIFSLYQAKDISAVKNDLGVINKTFDCGNPSIKSHARKICGEYEKFSVPGYRHISYYGKRTTVYGPPGNYPEIFTIWDEDFDRNVWTTMIDTLFMHKAIAELTGEGMIRGDAIKSVIEIGAGGGHLSAALATLFPHVKDLTYTDINPYALRAAKRTIDKYIRNGPKNGDEGTAVRTHALLGSGWPQPPAGNKFDLIVTNPPYIPVFGPAVKGHEAFSGTELIREMLGGAHLYLKDGHSVMIMLMSSVTEIDFHEPAFPEEKPIHYLRRNFPDITIDMPDMQLEVPFKIPEVKDDWLNFLVSSGKLHKISAAPFNKETYSHTLKILFIRKKPQPLIPG